MARGEIHHTICPLCEATCGLNLEVDDGRVRRITGNPEDHFSRGFLCPKGAALGELHEDPDRLRSPRVRDTDGVLKEATWEEAFSVIQARLLEARGKDPHAVAVYLGNPNVHSLAGAFMPRALLRALSTRNVFTASTVDQMPKHVACGLMFGDPFAIPVPDLDRSDFLLLLGANPWASNGSLCTAPDFPGRLKRLRARGGRFVVVDPRRTRTAEHADEHVPIRPGTDAFLLLGMIHVLDRDGLVRLDGQAAHYEGVEQVRELARPFTPQAVARKTGVPEEVIERLARDLAAAKRGAVYGRIGTHTVSFGTLAAWAVDALNALTGHLDTEGGAMWALPGHMPRPQAKPGKPFVLGRWKSRVRGLPEAGGELPAATLVDELETPGEGQVRVLITIAGNPVLSLPEGGRLDRALRDVPFMVSVDPYLNETTRHADVILPPPSPLTRSHYDVAFSRLSVRNHARWTPPVFEREGPAEEEILARLTLIAGGLPATTDPALVFAQVEQYLIGKALGDDRRLEGKKAAELLAQLEAERPMDRLLEILVRTGAYGDGFGADPEGLSFARLRATPEGVDLGPLKPMLPEVLATPSGKVELMPEPIRADLARLTEQLERAADPETFTLIGRRELRSNNSWMHNLPMLMKGKARCTLLVHPEDAAGLGLRDGDRARVRSEAGEVVVPVEVTETLMEGVVSLPHGYGHDLPGSGQQLAAQNPGVNFNLLTGANSLDPLSGNAVLNGLSVTLKPA